LSNAEQRDSWLNSGHQTLAADRGERGGTGICGGPTKKRVYPTFQVAPNFTSTFCSKKGWKTKNGIGLSTHKPVDDKKWVPPLIVDILDEVGKRKVFTKLDLRWGYNNIRIKEGDE